MDLRQFLQLVLFASLPCVAVAQAEPPPVENAHLLSPEEYKLVLNLEQKGTFTINTVDSSKKIQCLL